MIINITGAPGAGKTYLSIKLLLDKYYYWHNKNKCWVRKPECKKYTIFTNINGLKIDAKDLSEIMKEVPFDQFFSYEYQERIHQKYPNIVYVIDEIHDYMPPAYKNVDVIKYFSKHRHFGDHVFIITQDYTMICKTINKLCELEYRAVKSSFTFMGRFHYNIKSNGEIFKKLSAKKDERIFKIYKSFEGDDQQKTGNPIKILIAVGLVAFVILAYVTKQMILPDDKSKHEPKQITQTQNHQNKPKTYFIDESQKQALALEKQKELDQKKIRSVEIRDICIRKGTLFAFVCPFTNRVYIAPDFPQYYTVKEFSGHYYAILSLAQYNELSRESTTITPITTPHT
jgi:hypothetical protein